MQLAVVSDLGAIKETIQLYGPGLKKIGRPKFYKPYPEMIDRENPTQGSEKSLISSCYLEKMANPP